MSITSLVIDQNIRQAAPACRLGYSIISGAALRGTPPLLAQEFSQLQTELSKIYNLNILPTLPRISAVRNMYKKLSIDPSRYRPASEALVRRVLQNKGVYYVNSAVDVSNYCSIKFLQPFGLYDLQKIEGQVTYRVAAEGLYMNIAGHMVSTEGKPFLADDLGVFGNPTSDSRRTAVTLSTKDLLSVVYADEELLDSELSEILDFTAEMIVRYNGGKVQLKQIARA